jgi:hypothetical protein
VLLLHGLKTKENSKKKKDKGTSKKDKAAPSSPRRAREGNLVDFSGGGATLLVGIISLSTFFPSLSSSSTSSNSSPRSREGITSNQTQTLLEMIGVASNE